MFDSIVKAGALCLAALVAPALASAQTVPKPDQLQGDGRVSSFYTWERRIPQTPGRFLRAQELPAVLGLANAQHQYRFLYSSTSGIDGTTPVVVSGAYFEPKGHPPAGGWPLIAWAHGT
ncbi:MAG: alpha/beta hydrolase, partial [Candidatus Eremiobacteraeota bacterium]|nr:alpha/beta hydrolase [Candidatus Eremiobacteraeota bacterium]